MFKSTGTDFGGRSALIAERGNITLGALPAIECAATAADGHNSFALLVRRRKCESLQALLKRLDNPIGLAWSEDIFIDEVNDGRSDLVRGSQVWPGRDSRTPTNGAYFSHLSLETRTQSTCGSTKVRGVFD